MNESENKREITRENKRGVKQGDGLFTVFEIFKRLPRRFVEGEALPQDEEFVLAAASAVVEDAFDFVLRFADVPEQWSTACGGALVERRPGKSRTSD